MPSGLPDRESALFADFIWASAEPTATTDDLISLDRLIGLDVAHNVLHKHLRATTSFTAQSLSYPERTLIADPASSPDVHDVRRRRIRTSFWYIDRFGPMEFGKASPFVKTEDAGRVIFPMAKGVRKRAVPPMPMKFEPFKEFDGSRMLPMLKWTDIKQPPPPLQVSDLNGFTADKLMQRAKEAAIICDHAQIEAWKQADIARYWTRQAQAFEAAAMRALRHSQPGHSFETDPPLKMNEYPISPDSHWQKQMLSPPPGWESPGAVENPLHSPEPSNMFTLHAPAGEPELHADPNAQPSGCSQQ